MKLKHWIAVIFFFGGMTIIPALFWVAGFDFDQRGETALICTLLVLFVSIGGAVAAATYPS